MVKIFKLHKFFGLSAGIVLLILGISGFLLDHDRWDFLYTTELKGTEALKKIDTRLYTSYWRDPSLKRHIVVGAKHGIYESFDEGKSFEAIARVQCQKIVAHNKNVFFATSKGVYRLHKSRIVPFALEGKYINAMAAHGDTLVTVVDKKKVYLLSLETATVLHSFELHVDEKELQEVISLSRFVRDLHYGRGIFDGDISLLLNDYGALFLSALALSGYFIWWVIRRKTSPKLAKKLIKIHANILAVAAMIPLVILAISGIFLDHSSSLRNFMSSVKIPHSILPPVYNSLREDIWSVDFDGKVYRIGNRYGVYRSEDTQNWKLESRGFAYAMVRKEGTLYVSGMGAFNRVYDNGRWEILVDTPHMFKDVVQEGGGVKFFAGSTLDTFSLPKRHNVTLYALILGLHDGTFFSKWWIWINDYASVALIILAFTGFIRWYRKKRVRKPSLVKG